MENPWPKEGPAKTCVNPILDLRLPRVIGYAEAVAEMYLSTRTRTQAWARKRKVLRAMRGEVFMVRNGLEDVWLLNLEGSRESMRR